MCPVRGDACLQPNVPPPCRELAEHVHGQDGSFLRRAIMDEIVKEFLIESSENLDRLDQELVKLESEPSSKELLASIFRTIHTIKGSCSFLGFPRLEKLAHAGESLLSRLRDGDLVLTEPIASALLAMVDAVRQMLGAIENSGQDGTEDYADLIERMAELQKPLPSGSAPSDQCQPSSAPSSAMNQPENAQARQGNQEASAPKIPEDAPPCSDSAAVTIAPPREPPAKVTADASNPSTAGETIRVAVNLLDCLMNLVGELVLARNQLLQFHNRVPDAGFQAVCQRTNLVTTELQEQVMKTRMQPIENIWNKFPRTVRDLALHRGKDVRLEMEGQNTELDRTVIEAIRDPLTHLVRNAIDHGLEMPDARKRAGKDTVGVLRLRAFHEGGQVNIEVSDDGAGLNRERIRQKAVEHGLLSSQTAASAADHELFQLIFLPGFSTAEKVTSVSGRGVGMDVVRTGVEKIGGTVDVQSADGKGTNIRIKIPLTLAIIPALMIASGGERFAIPQASLLELIRLEAGTGIEMVHGAPVYRLRGRLLPLVYLNAELQIDPRVPAATADSTLNIAVLQADGREFGLVVDDIIDTEEIVVKPLAKQLRGIKAYSGANILGDGRVALILDIPGLARRARVISESREHAAKLADFGRESAAGQDALLVVECGDRSRMAIPLSLVSRLEEFPTTAVEPTGTMEVIQYRGQIMPLVRLSRVVSGVEPRSEGAESSLQVVVSGQADRSVGLVVDKILDIVDEHPRVEKRSRRYGVLGSSVVQQRVTEVLDVPALVSTAIAGGDEPPS